MEVALPKIKRDELDAHFGQCVRALRLGAGLSQQELGNRLGVSFQQIQKYENGSNRLSASVLFRIAQLFGVEVSHFLENAPAETPAEEESGGKRQRSMLHDFAASSEGRALLEAYLNIGSEQTRRSALQLLRRLAES